MDELTNPRSKQIHFTLHKYQAEAFKAYEDPEIRTICLISGIQGGKTLTGILMLHYDVMHCKDPQATWAVTAPDYKTLAQSTMVTFDKVFKRLGKMNEMKQEFTLHDGRKIFFRTVSKNPYSVEGLPNCRFIHADEAGLYPRLAWVNIQSRLAMKGGRCVITTTPYSLGWLWKDVVKPAQQGSAPDIAYFRWSSADNPAFSKEDFERMKTKLSPREFERKFLGVFNRMEGLIFADFGPNNWVEPRTFPPETKYYGGIDWGFDHPTALVVRAFPGDGHCYTVSVFKRSGLSVTQVIDLIRSKQKLFGVTAWYCGHDRPDIIKELNRENISALSYLDANKDYRLVTAGNQKHNELIRSGQYRVFQGIDQWEDLEDEYLTYSWKKKEFEDDSGKEKPNDVNDDLMAAERYCSVGTFHLLYDSISEVRPPLNVPYTVDEFDPEEVEQERTWSSY